MGQSLIGAFDRLHNSIQIQSQALATLQEQATTGARVNRVSDDPLAAREILSLNSEVRSFSNYTNTIESIYSMLGVCDQQITQITDDLASAQTETTKALGGLLNSDQRTNIANGINELLEDAVTQANKQYLGNYVFAGSSTSSPAYNVERSGGKITAVIYAGSSQARQVDVGPGTTAASSMVGETTFGAQGTPTLVFPPQGTGASAGTGTSTATGIVWLKVEQDDSGYKLSIDDGATWTTADGSTNQAVTDSRTGATLYVNSSSITKEGTDLVQMSGTMDVFSTLIAVRDAITSGDTSKITQLQARAESIFSETRQSVVNSSTWVGSKMNGLNNLKEMLTQMSNNTNDRISQVQDADIAQVAIDLSRYQTLYQMSLTVAAKTLSMNLLDFIGTT
jgi:flagellar hook-associated protein 3 FlgL